MAEKIQKTAPSSSLKSKPDEDPTFFYGKTLYSWKSIIRPFGQKSRQFYLRVILLSFVIGVILFFFEGIAPVIVLASVLFLIFILPLRTGGEVENKITQIGLVIGKDIIPWNQLISYWFEKKGEYFYLCFETVGVLGVISLQIPENAKERVGEIIAKRLPLKIRRRSFLERLTKLIERSFY